MHDAKRAGSAFIKLISSALKSAGKAVADVVKAGWDNARARSQSPDSGGVKIEGSAGVKADDRFDETKASIGVKAEKKVFDEELLFYGDEEGTNLRIGHAEGKAAVGYDYDPETAVHSIDVVKLEGSPAVVKAETQGKTLKGALEGKGEIEALSAGANLDAGVSFGGDVGFEAKAGVGAEANLVKGSAQGQVNITPKTIYDNSIGAVVGLFSPGSSWASAPDYLDHGIVVGAKGEAGIGAAAKAEAAVGKDEEKGAWGISAEAKAGFGPMAGLKLFLGVK